MTRDQLLSHISNIHFGYLLNVWADLGGISGVDEYAFGFFLIDTYGEDAVLKALKERGYVDLDSDTVTESDIDKGFFESFEAGDYDEKTVPEPTQPGNSGRKDP